MKLKKKNRQRLEDWHIEMNVNTIFEYVKSYQLSSIEHLCRYGFTGVEELTDTELVKEYKNYEKSLR